MSENTALKRYLVSCASLGIAGVCTAPFDVVKTRLQTQTMQRAASASSAASPAPLGMFGMARHIWVTESPAALMKGTVAMLGRMLTHGALRMSLYEPVKDGLLGLVAVDTSRSSTSGTGSQPPLSPAAMFGVKIVAGACSGAFAALASNPMEMLKVRSQTERSNISTWALLRKILATEGLVAMWSAGVTASMQRSALLNSAYRP